MAPRRVKLLAALIAALMVLVAIVPESSAQRRGGGFGGGYGGGYGTYRPPPVFRQPQMRTPTMTPRMPSTSPRVAGPMQPRAPSIRGPNPRGATQPIPGRPGVSTPATRAPAAKAPATVAKLPTFKGQYSNGKPILQYKGKNYRVPEKGVLSASRAKLLSGASTTAINARLSKNKKLFFQQKIARVSTVSQAKEVQKLPSNTKVQEHFADNPEILKGRSFEQAESILDNALVQKGGWKKSLSRDGNGIRYIDGKGGAVIINKGYAGGLQGGGGDTLHRGPYVKISPEDVRIPLAGNPTLKARK